MKAYWERRGIAPRILDLCIRWKKIIRRLSEVQFSGRNSNQEPQEYKSQALQLEFYSLCNEYVRLLRIVIKVKVESIPNELRVMSKTLLHLLAPYERHICSTCQHSCKHHYSQKRYLN
jgi:hypothetical protein